MHGKAVTVTLSLLVLTGFVVFDELLFIIIIVSHVFLTAAVVAAVAAIVVVAALVPPGAQLNQKTFFMRQKLNF